jgi:hypothetical protein
MLIWIRNLLDPGSGIEKFVSGIQDKYPGSAILVPKDRLRFRNAPPINQMLSLPNTIETVEK